MSVIPGFETKDPQVLIIEKGEFRSPHVSYIIKLLDALGIRYRSTSLHLIRDMHRIISIVREARPEGVKVIIARVSHDSSLLRILSDYTTLPVIWVPIVSVGFRRISQFSQMSRDISVGTVTADSKTAAIFAARILAANDEQLAARLETFKEEMGAELEKKADRIKEQFLE